jgi:pilus assembly protein Flp/PilA
MLIRYWRDEGGATAIEYGLLSALIAVAMIGGLSQAGSAISDLFGDNAGKVQQALN